MGEVYRAHDPRLIRDVALKVLPELFAADPERLARFQREAQVLAALKHPNIGVIYGLEEGVRDGGVQLRALVLELVEGDTLADRIARGPVASDEALPIAKQIAEALEAAHEQGVIHRDLKPSNIKITPDGLVKVLDFGLAKLVEAGRAGGASRAGGAAGAGGIEGPGGLAALSMSPTITSPAATGLGVILGTAAYMAPEQAKGRPADKRSDVWAFGCVLYEMLAGKRAFDGDDVSDTLATVLKGEPDWTALPANLPPAVRTMLKRCLEKDRRKRIGDIAAALFAIDEAPSLVIAAAAESPAPMSRTDVKSLPFRRTSPERTSYPA
jgi:serine/threonine protein kinase